MTIIAPSLPRLPSVEEATVGRNFQGATWGGLAAAVNHLAGWRLRMAGTTLMYADATAAELDTQTPTGFSANNAWHIWQSSPMASHVWTFADVYAGTAAWDKPTTAPQVTLILESHPAAATLDAIQFKQSDGTLLQAYEGVQGGERWRQIMLCSGDGRDDASTPPTGPRAMFIPLVNRGQVLRVRASNIADVRIMGITVIEAFEEVA